MENYANENELGTKPIGKLLFGLAVPAITAQIVNVLYNMVDRMYIGHIPNIGAFALTGVGVTFPIIMLVSAFATLASMGGAPRASIMMGRGDHLEAERILGNCTSALAGTAVLLTAAIFLFGKQLLMMFGASEATIGYAWEYLSIYAVGTISVQMALGLNAFITAQGFSKISMLTVLLGAICNIVLDPIFIFGFGMGVRGAAWATVISQTVSAVWVLRFLSGKKTGLKIKTENLRIKPKVYLPCMALGLSPFIMQSTESILTVCFNSSLLRFGGDMAVGAMTILSSVMQFSMLPLQGLTQGAQPIVGYNYGADNRERVKKCFTLLVICCLTYSGFLWALVMLFPQIFAAMFTNDAALTAITVHSLRIYMAASGIFGIQIACQQTFIAVGNAKTSVFLALLRKVFLLIPLIFILPSFMPNKVDAVFLAEPIADAIAVTVTAIMFWRYFSRYLKGQKL
ncbi:MAG: MATE family efflux transporter [Clostridia bacterium]